MVRVKKDPEKVMYHNRKLVDAILKKFEFDVENTTLGGQIYKDTIHVGRYSYFLTCQIFGESSVFAEIAEAIEKELGIEVIIYE